MMTKKERKNRLINLGIWSGGIVVVLLAMYLVKLTFGSYVDGLFSALNSVIIPAAISVFVFYLVNPIFLKLLKMTKKRRISALLTVLTFLLVLFSFFFLVGFMLTEQISVLVIRINDEWPLINLLNLIPEEILEQVRNPLTGYIEVGRAIVFVMENLDMTFNYVFDQTINVLGLISHWSLILTLTPVFLYFFLVDGPKIFSVGSSYIPKKLFREEIVAVAEIANQSTGRYMRGKMLSILALSVIFSVFFSLVFIIFNKMPLGTAILYGILFAIIISVLDLVPFIGPLIGIILPVGFVLILSESTTEFFIYAGVLLVLNMIAQEIQKGLIEPVIMSKEVELHPVGILMGMLFFGALFGFAGFILATPLVSTIHSTRLYFIKKYEEEDKQETQVQDEQISDKLQKATDEIQKMIEK
jgi:predicted PurR-regulated permease PerM